MRKLFKRRVWLIVLLLLAVALMGAGPAQQDTEPAKTVTVSAGDDQTAEAGAKVTLKATAKAEDGSKVTGWEWKQVSGTAAKISGADSDTLAVTLGDTNAYKAELMAWLMREDRFGVQGISPHSLEAAEIAVFEVTVTTDSGTYSDTVEVVVHLPYAISTGVRNVGVGTPVLLGGKVQDSYSWKLTGPSGAKATLSDATDRNPSFTPDVAGKYTVTESTSGATFDVYAGTWMGIITGLDDDGLPEVTASCTACHNGKIAGDQFTPWKVSGHAEILKQNIDDPAGHWSLSCASCHSVGWDTEAGNGGFDEAIAEEGWEAPHGAVGNFETMLKDYPKSAQLANIQCENCHGPQESDAHTVGAARQTLSADICGSCHGEPPRHGRFQQWEESGHANLELVLEEGTVEARGGTAAHCGRCHSGEGFVAWVAQGDLTKNIQGADGNATVEEMTALGMTNDSVHAITCTVCHDPHNVGKSSGEPNTATVRVSDSTAMLPAGFKAVGVGRGALCMTCHNTRNGAANDTTGAPAGFRAPHTAAQADVMMGENAFFVTTGTRANHALIEDSCTGCHMTRTPPPAELSYNLAGTNHEFAASMDICADCHGAFTGAGLQKATEAMVHELADQMGAYLISKMPATVQIKDYTPHEFEGEEFDVLSDAVTVDAANIVATEPTEPHGRQGFILTFKTPVEVTYSPEGMTPHKMSLTQAEVRIADITTDGETALIAEDDVLAKAGWNYWLIHGDGSHGVHNPTFTLNVLKATIAALSTTAE